MFEKKSPFACLILVEPDNDDLLSFNYLETTLILLFFIKLCVGPSQLTRVRLYHKRRIENAIKSS